MVIAIEVMTDEDWMMAVRTAPISTNSKGLLIERTREFDDAYRRRYRLGPSSTVNSSKRKLLEDGHIEQIATECRIADPFFAEFLRLV